MRRDLACMASDIGHHRLDIGREDGLVERDQRQRHASIKWLPALSTDPIQRHRRMAGRKAADPVVENGGFAGNRGYWHGRSLLHRVRASRPEISSSARISAPNMMLRAPGGALM